MTTYRKTFNSNPPSKFPAAVELRHPEGNVDFLVADMSAYWGFRGNIKEGDRFKFDRGALVSAVREADKKVLTLEALSKCLLPGMTWKEPAPPDGNPLQCGFCSKEFQPVVLGTFERGGEIFQGGNVLITKRLTFEAALETLKGTEKALAERILKSVLAFTAGVVGNEAQAPDMAIATMQCPACKARTYFPKASFVAIGDAARALQSADQKIGAAVEEARFEKALESAFGGGRDNRHPRQHASGGGVHAGPPPKGARGGYGRPGGGSKDSRVESVGGLLLFPSQAAAISAAGYTTLAEVLVDAESGAIKEKSGGVIDDRGVDYILRAIRAINLALAPKPVAGSAAAVVAPGAEAPVQKTVSPKTKKGTRRQFTAKASVSDDGGSGKRKSSRPRAGVQEALGD